MKVFKQDGSNGADLNYKEYTIYDRHLLVLDSAGNVKVVFAPNAWGVVDGGTLTRLPAKYKNTIKTGLEE